MLDDVVDESVLSPARMTFLHEIRNPSVLRKATVRAVPEHRRPKGPLFGNLPKRVPERGFAPPHNSHWYSSEERGSAYFCREAWCWWWLMPFQGVDMVKLVCQRGWGRGPIWNNVHESLDSERGPIWGNVHESFVLEILTLQSNVWSEMKGVLGK